MSELLPGLLGGTGLFLLGMILLTDGLKALAGDSLRAFLARFTGGRFSSVAAGAGITALVQSSSATTLATIGFVSAGLLSFEQALGVILGANLGTTSTGWLVSVLGLKLSVGKVALPLVGVGALARLLGGERLRDLGLAVAGFGLIFVGIETLQVGMAGLAGRIDPASFPGAGPGGRLILVLVGALMTVVMQSSSAAVATTLTALHSGAIDLPQAAALVIGQNVGTTVTAALGALGASDAARRTALAHMLFNLLTGALAFLILPFAVRGLELGGARVGVSAPALLIAAFHTAFNVLGVLVFLPVLGQFSRLVVWLIPERGPRLTRFLGPVVAQGPLAIEAAGLATRATLEESLRAVLELLDPATRGRAASRLGPIQQAVVELREHLGMVRASHGAQLERHLGLLHAVDHLERLAEACAEKQFLAQVREHADVVEVVGTLERAARACLEAIEADAPLPREVLEEASRGIAASRRRGRATLLMAAASGEVAPARGSKVLETVRWIDRLAFHAWRATHHLAGADPTGIPDAELPEDEPADDEPGVEAVGGDA